jgi:geranylgeranyl diphosphate synthase type I
MKPDPGDPTLSILPLLACEANGGDPRRAAPVMAAWQLLRLAAKLFDDVEDGEASGQPAKVINVATGLLFVTQLVVGELAAQGMTSDLVQRLGQALNHAGLRACAGQHADLAGQVEMTNADPDVWLEIALAKSGEPLAWAAWAGALVAGADEHTLACYREYGYHLGVLLQVADDFNGVWQPGSVSDLAVGRFTLPVCYALSVAKAEERDRLETLLEEAAQGNDMAEVQARQLLTDLGAQAYLLVVGRVQHQQAMAALRSANCVSPADQQLAALLNRVLPALSYAEG